MSTQDKSKRMSDAENAYDAQYPYNQVIEWPSGHQIQIDNTPGKERIIVQHTSGSYTLMTADGSTFNYTVGDGKSYSKGGHTFSVDEAGDVKFSGHTRILVAGGAHIEVAGDAGVFAGGDMVAAVIGKLNARASSAYIGTDGDMNMNVGGNMNIKTGGSMTMESGGDNITKAAKITHN